MSHSNGNPERNTNAPTSFVLTGDRVRRLSPEQMAMVGLPKLVYVREVRAGDLTAELGDLDIPADTKLYAVHAANGERMAIVDDRQTAFAGARQWDLEPLSVH